MSITISQAIEASYVPHRSAEIVFTITGAADEQAAALALGDETRGEGNYAPKIYKDLFRKERRVEAVHIASDDEGETDLVKQNIFHATVTYSHIDPDSFITTFDTTGGSQHITQSFFTRKYPAEGAWEAPHMQGAIGYDGQRVNGTDIVIAVYNFTEQHWLTKADCDTEYRMKLALLTSGVNDAPFRGFAAGEVHFLGVSGNIAINDSADDDPLDPDEGPEQWNLTFQFAASPNRLIANGNALTVGTIENVEKFGWEYLWVLYGDDVSLDRLIQRPVGVYCERLYPWVDFSDLKIGTE